MHLVRPLVLASSVQFPARAVARIFSQGAASGGGSAQGAGHPDLANGGGIAPSCPIAGHSPAPLLFPSHSAYCRVRRKVLLNLGGGVSCPRGASGKPLEPRCRGRVGLAVGLAGLSQGQMEEPGSRK